MIPLIDFQERSLTGPVMKTDDFDLEFAMKIRELVSKYNIKYNPDELVVDDETADAVFNAGVELLADVGLYHLNTQRVVKYTKEEILQFTNERKENPSKITMGSGDDEMVIEYRTSADKRQPVMYAGVAGAIQEDDFVPFLLSFAREKSIKGFAISGGIIKVGDIEPKAGTLSEIHCAIWEQEKLKEVLEKAGRPGMSLGLLCTASTVGATMQAIRPGFRDERNTHIGVHVIPEQKIDWDRLLLSHFCHDRGIVPWQSAMSLLGGLCRDAADASVGLVANMLGHMSYAHGPICSLFPNHMDGSWGTRETDWTVSAAARASERNVKIATGSVLAGDFMWGRTLVGILQEAAQTVIYTASGLAYAWLAGYTALETRLIDDIFKVVSGMDREQCIEIANSIMARVDELLKTEEKPMIPVEWTDVYDVDTLEPKEEYAAIVDKGRAELAACGVPFYAN